MVIDSRNKTVLTVARTVRPDQFSNSAIADRFRLFITNECGDRQLCRMIVCTTKDVCGPFMAEMFPGYADPHWIWKSLGTDQRTAEVMKVGNTIIAQKRVGERMEELVIPDMTNSAEVLLLYGHLVAFSLRTLKPEQQLLTKGGIEDSVQFYVTSRNFPDAAEGLRVLNELLGLAGLTRGRLYLRHDTSFGPFGGPLCDMSIGCRSALRPTFDTSETMFCWVSRGDGSCRTIRGISR